MALGRPAAQDFAFIAAGEGLLKTVLPGLDFLEQVATNFRNAYGLNRLPRMRKAGIHGRKGMSQLRLPDSGEVGTRAAGRVGHGGSAGAHGAAGGNPAVLVGFLLVSVLLLADCAADSRVFSPGLDGAAHLPGTCDAGAGAAVEVLPGL